MTMILQRRRNLMMGNNPYEEIKYLQSSGHQYIDTLFVPKVECKLVLDMAALNDSDTDYFGFQNNSYPAWIGDIRFRGVVYDITPFYRYGSTAKLPTLTVFPVAGRCTVTAGRELIIDDVAVTQSSGQVDFSTNSQSLFIFRGRTYAYAQVYSAAIKDYNTEQTYENLVPRLRKSDNKPGLLDLVTNTFYTNQGTGEFGYEKLDGTIVNPI